MLVLFAFDVIAPQGAKRSPSLLSGDMRRLEGLFPTNPALKDEKHNVIRISIEQARRLYDEMVGYYAETAVSAELYEGNAIGPIFLTTDLQSVFDELIAFFETELGFTCSVELKAAIVAKQQERKDRAEAAHASYSAEALAFFKTLGALGPPTSANIRERLSAKLAEYRIRLLEDPRWEFKHPRLAFLNEKGYRDTIYKVAVAEAILGSAAPISLAFLAAQQLEKYGERFNAAEFAMVCDVMGLYLETPLTGDVQLLKRVNGKTIPVEL